MNWVDIAVVAVAAVSGLVGIARGFVRESLGIGAWVGAGYVAVALAPNLQDRFTGWLGNPDLGHPAAYAAVFMVCLIIFSVLAGWIGTAVQSTALSGVDRSLGALFGIARGFALVVATYVITGFAIPAGKWPDAVREARLQPTVAEAANWVSAQLPASYRPSLPLIGVDSAPRLPQLLQAPPVGRARP